MVHELGWQENSACQSEYPDLFFPSERVEYGTGGNNSRPEAKARSSEAKYQQKAAKAICGECEVRERCLEFALDHEIPVGIWGGLTVRERNKLLRQGA